MNMLSKTKVNGVPDVKHPVFQDTEAVEFVCSVDHQLNGAPDARKTKKRKGIEISIRTRR